MILKSAQARCEGPIEDEVELFDWLKMVVVNCVGEIMENSPRGSGFARTGPLVSISGYLEVDVQIGGKPLIERFEIADLSQFLGGCLPQLIIFHGRFD